MSNFNVGIKIDLFEQRDKLRAENEALKKRIERIEDAGDSILVWMMFNRSHMGGMDVDSALREWKQAKKGGKAVSDTPRTDSRLTAILNSDGFAHNGNCPQRWVNHARELERELNAATSEVDRLRKANLQLREGAEEQKQRIKRLEEAGDRMEKLMPDGSICDKAANAWREAKEAKL